MFEQERSRFADMGAAAAGIDADAARLEQPGGPAAAPAAPAGPVVVDWNAESRDLVEFAAELFFPLWPRLATVWTEEALIVDGRLAAVLKKRGLNMERILGQWGAEIMLAAAIVPAVVPTVQAIKADNADHRAAEKTGAAPVKAATPAAAAAAPEAGPTDNNELHQENGNPNMAAPAPDKLQLYNEA